MSLYIDTHLQKVLFILFENGKILTKIEKDSSFNHNAIIMSTLDQMLKGNNIKLESIQDIIVINGPGSFTGIRLGVTIAKVLAYTLNIPIRVMSSILIQAISNVEKGNHWFVEEEKNGYFVGEFNELDELLNDYIYIKRSDYEIFKSDRQVIENVSLDFLKIYEYSRTLPSVNPHLVKPLYVKLIEVQK